MLRGTAGAQVLATLARAIGAVNEEARDLS
ncbi:hypothetical protein THITH_12535 [Thioalkalivibrio paradoxus ARh 1]|uniref:Uncharacterized protein n=1 Tax=Thioalkalivibrio paradoxus ARh 1 TaxID=713585 RepID=W0DSI6_9GAMM|nr:hypothetical protein THITH_12535 [Thioalkalivibrio paradoxus ARh 1]